MPELLFVRATSGRYCVRLCGRQTATRPCKHTSPNKCTPRYSSSPERVALLTSFPTHFVPHLISRPCICWSVDLQVALGQRGAGRQHLFEARWDHITWTWTWVSSTESRSLVKRTADCHSIVGSIVTVCLRPYLWVTVRTEHGPRRSPSAPLLRRVVLEGRVHDHARSTNGSDAHYRRVADQGKGSCIFRMQ